MKQVNVLISLVIPGLCILAGFWMVADSIDNHAASQDGSEQVKGNTVTEAQLMSHLELKEYLGINEEQLAKILPKKDGNVTTSKIPYIKIGYEYFFPVKAIDKWLTEAEAEIFR